MKRVCDNQFSGIRSDYMPITAEVVIYVIAHMSAI